MGKAYDQAETALRVPDLIESPENGSTGELVEAVGIEPTSEDPRPQASTSMSGLLYDSLALRPSIRQEDRGASLKVLALPLRPGSEPAPGI